MGATGTRSGASDASHATQFRTLDKSNRGYLQRNDVTGISGFSFDQADVNHDGRVSQDEFAQWQAQNSRAGGAMGNGSGMAQFRHAERPGRQLRHDTLTQAQCESARAGAIRRSSLLVAELAQERGALLRAQVLRARGARTRGAYAQSRAAFFVTTCAIGPRYTASRAVT